MLYLTSDPTYIGIHAFSLALLLLALGYYLSASRHHPLR